MPLWRETFFLNVYIGFLIQKPHWKYAKNKHKEHMVDLLNK